VLCAASFPSNPIDSNPHRLDCHEITRDRAIELLRDKLSMEEKDLPPDLQAHARGESNPGLDMPPAIMARLTAPEPGKHIESKERKTYTAREHSVASILEQIRIASESGNWNLSKNELRLRSGVPESSFKRYMDDEECLQDAWRNFSRRAMYSR
jgi:hypothetical protein